MGGTVSLPDAYSALTGFDTKYILELSTIQIKSVIETVKNIILEWLLKLEEDGIIGDDMEFTKDEKDKAEKNNYTINNFYGNISNSQIQQNSSNSTQNMTIIGEKERIYEILNIIKENIDQIKDIDHAKVNDNINNIETEIKKSNPNSNKIKEALKTIRNIFEGAVGSIIASGILYKISQLKLW